jgi:ATP-binding cassette subfamily B protein RaxB
MISGLLNFAGRRRLPLVLQAEATECGLACLAMVASYHGHRTDLNALRRRHPVSMSGVTLRGLMQVASDMRMACRPLRIEPEHLGQLRLPAILHWDMNHFVVLKAVTRQGVVVHDPATGEQRLPLAETVRHLTGRGPGVVPERRLREAGRAHPPAALRLPGAHAGVAASADAGLRAVHPARDPGHRRALLHAVDGGRGDRPRAMRTCCWCWRSASAC